MDKNEAIYTVLSSEIKAFVKYNNINDLADVIEYIPRLAVELQTVPINEVLSMLTILIEKGDDFKTAVLRVLNERFDERN